MTDVIFGSPSKIAWAIGIPIGRLVSIANSPSKFYKPFPKKKPNGKIRNIDNPIGELKDIQTRLNAELLSGLPLPGYMIGGVRGRNPLDHPGYHIGKKVVVTIDVKNCFPSITNKRIFDVYRNSVKCSPAVARLLIQLTTYKGHLPLGSPTSTVLANLVLVPITLEIEKLVEKHGFELSQFVDDTALSGNQLDDNLITEIVKIFSRHKLQIGREKIKVMRSGKAQIVTGKTVNTRAAIPFQRRKKVRAALHQLSETLPTNPNYEKLYHSVHGRVAEVKRLHPREGKRLTTRLSSIPEPPRNSRPLEVNT